MFGSKNKFSIVTVYLQLSIWKSVCFVLAREAFSNKHRFITKHSFLYCVFTSLMIGFSPEEQKERKNCKVRQK